MKNHNTVVKGGPYITRSLTHISITKYVLEFMINLYRTHIIHILKSDISKIYTELYFLVLVMLAAFGSYQVLLGYPSCNTYFIKTYSSLLTTFIFIFIVKFESYKFSNTHSRTYPRTPEKLTYRGGTGPPKNRTGDIRSIQNRPIS